MTLTIGVLFVTKWTVLAAASRAACGWDFLYPGAITDSPVLGMLLVKQFCPDGMIRAEVPMLKQYDLLSKSLKLLKNSEMQPIQELTVEVQLIRAKRLLLVDEVYLHVKGNAESETEFERLFRQVEEVCHSSHDLAEVEKLTLLSTGVVDGLRRYLTSESDYKVPSSRNPLPPFRGNLMRTASKPGMPAGN